MVSMAIGLFIAMQIAVVVAGFLRSRQNDCGDSIERFEVKPDPMIRLILIGCSAVLMAPAIPCSLSGKDMRIFFIGMGLPLLMAAICLPGKIRVDGNGIRVRSRIYTFSDITHYSASDDTITAYKGKEKLFSFDMDFVGAENMLRRFAKEGIAVGGQVKPIRKSDIGSIKHATTAKALFFISVTVFFAFSLYGLLHNGVKEFIAYNLIGVALGSILSGSFLLYYRKKCRTIIECMEKALGINFDAEMKRLGIDSFKYRDREWFGLSWNMWKLMIKHDYIGKIERVEWDKRAHCETVTFLAIDGKRFSFKEGERNGFTTWWFYR